MAIDLREHLVLLHPAEDVLDDDTPPRVEAVEPPLGPAEHPMVPAPLDRRTELVAGMVGRGPVIAPVEGVARRSRELSRGLLALEEGVVMDAAWDALADAEDTPPPIDRQLGLDRMALALTGVLAALGAARGPTTGLLGGIRDDLGELRVAVEALLPGADLLRAGREPTPEGQPQRGISRRLQ